MEQVKQIVLTLSRSDESGQGLKRVACDLGRPPDPVDLSRTLDHLQTPDDRPGVNEVDPGKRLPESKEIRDRHRETGPRADLNADSVPGGCDPAQRIDHETYSVVARAGCRPRSHIGNPAHRPEPGDV